jgi:tetratricopeptide (TPR) repeat protein
MEKDLGSDNLIDFGKVYELTAWNQLLDLQEKVTEGENTSLNYQLIGDKLMSLGDMEQALAALEESVKLDSKNGVAWALLSHIYYQILIKHLNEHHKALARTEFNGFIENPINSEEYWINERVEDTYNDVSTLREQFVNVAIKALRYWPSWEGVPIRLKDGTEKPNYYYSLEQSGEVSLELKRERLFLLLLNQINEQDFLQNREQCVEILRSVQHWNIDLYPLTNIHMFPINCYEPLIRYISWVDQDEVTNVIEKLAKQLECDSYSADKSIQFLQNPFVSQMFWNRLGRQKYTNLLMSLESMVCKNFSNIRIETLATLQLDGVLKCFTGLSKLLQEESKSGERFGDATEEAKSQLEVSCRNSMKFIDGWNSYLGDALYTKNGHATGDRHVLIFMASFIEIYNDLNINKNSEIMMGFVNNKQCFSSVRTRLDERVISLLFNFILSGKKFFGTSLYDAIQALITLDQELAMEDLDFY